MVGHLDGPMLEAWLRSVTGLDGWVVRTRTTGVATAWSSCFRLSAQTNVYKAKTVWLQELKSKGLLNLPPQ